MLERLGIAHLFEVIFDIAAARYVPKPAPEAYERMVRETGVRPARTLIVDDIPRNLEPAAALGMTTVWLRSETEYARMGAQEGAHIHHVADDLAAWLDAVARARTRSAPAAPGG